MRVQAGSALGKRVRYAEMGIEERKSYKERLWMHLYSNAEHQVRGRRVRPNREANRAFLKVSADIAGMEGDIAEQQRLEGWVSFLGTERE